VAAWRAAALAVFVLHAGFAERPDPVSTVRASVSSLATLQQQASHRMGSREVNRVTRWIERRTGPTDPVLFLPNNAAYYYLTDRPSPIRFVMGHQIVTEAHRAEVFADLRANPPRFIVWDHAALRVDGHSDELVFGGELLGWIRESYEEEARLGSVEIMGPRRLVEPADP